tara:strand:+ start:453 stop:587 length:135 start_codon:yes stop_codon:yes gene_type:complete
MKCPKCERSLIPSFEGYYMRRYGVCQECLDKIRSERNEKESDNS